MRRCSCDIRRSYRRGAKGVAPDERYGAGLSGTSAKLLRLVDERRTSFSPRFVFMPRLQTTEDVRLEDNRIRKGYWKRWGPYLSERQWGTVREDYSPGSTAWEFFPHDHARSRAYRWGEDGLGGICDRHPMMCFALAMWKGRDPIFKHRPLGF